MENAVIWAENLVGSIPLPMLEAWGKFAYLVGTVLAFCAYTGFTFRAGGGWRFGRERNQWGLKAVLAIPITFVLIVLSGFLGSFLVLVPGAQTFEALKDVAVFLCLLFFGYPALLTTPLAYGLSDIIEGVAIENMMDWWYGYLINPAFFWLGCQFLGRDPDFRKWKTWPAYLAFVTVFLNCQPIFWGLVCADRLTPELSYGKVTPALLLTMSSTWLLTPLVTLVAYPLVKKVGYYWAEIPFRIQQRAWSSSEWEWVKAGGLRTPSTVPMGSMPVRMFLLTPFAALMLLMLGIMAMVTLRGAEQDVTNLARQLHREYAANIGHQLDRLMGEPVEDAIELKNLSDFLRRLDFARDGRILVLGSRGKVMGSTAPGNDPVTLAARRYIQERPGQAQIGSFVIEQVNEESLELETWLGYRTPYTLADSRRTRWTVVTLMPESFYLQGVRTGYSRAATLFVVALLSSLGVALILSGVVTSQLRSLSSTAARLAAGDLTQRASEGRFLRLRELDVLASSFNSMAGKLEDSFRNLVTEVEHRRTVESELLVHQEGLEELVRLRTQELSRAVERAEAASYAKSRFLALMGHELRTPLNAILGYSQLLLRDSELPTAQKFHLQAIHSSGEHLLRLVNDVLEMSRIESGQRALNMETFNPKVLVGEAVAMFGPEALAAGIDMTEEFGVDMPVAVDQDAGKVRQILINLLDNAIKFTQCGLIKVRCYVRPGEEEGGSSLVLEVEDSGCGIAEPDLKLIFESFTQLEDGVRVGGVGLGLAVCQNFADQMGGTIEAESVVGQGSTFRLAVPIRKTSRSRCEGPRPEGEWRRMLRVPKILVVNDSEVNRILFSSLFSSEGFDLRQIGKDTDVAFSVKTWSPDLVILDLQGCGEECLKVIRLLKEVDPRMSLLTIDFSDVSGGKEAALEAGADTVLSGLAECSEILKQVCLLLERRDDEAKRENNRAEKETSLSQSGLSEELGRLPTELLRRIRSAALSARSQALLGLLSEVRGYCPAGAEEIESMIERFDYTELLKVLPKDTAAESERE